jgi:hypothetical protein
MRRTSRPPWTSSRPRAARLQRGFMCENATRTLLIITTLAAAASACLSVPTPARAANACSLLSPAEVGALLGTKFRPSEGAESRACGWTEQDSKQWRSVHLTQLSPEAFAMTKSANSPDPETRENGLGDEAVFIHPPEMIFNLLVRKGDTCLRIQARTNPKA